MQNKAKYYRLLRAVTKKHAWEPWILYNLDAVEETATWTNEKISAVRRLMNETERYIALKLPKITHKGVVETIFKQPYCRIRNLQDAGIAERQTASVYLKQFCAIGVLKEIAKGRDKLFLHPKFVDLLSKNDNKFTEYK